MAFMWIEVLAPATLTDPLRKSAEEAGASEITIGAADDHGRRALRVLVGEIDRQELLDQMQGILQGVGDWRIVLSETAAVIPHTDAEDAREQEAAEERRSRNRSASREELYQAVAKGAGLSANYFALVALSAVVAAIGLIEDNVAVLIGAMVIAPLLGPHLALALGVAIGDRELIGRAIVTAAAGLGFAILLVTPVPFLIDIDLGSGELAARTAVDFDSVLLALASGAAAALSITTGLSATLVGVMVAVALMPPAVTVGLALAAVDWRAAAGAGVLLAVNIVSVNIAANMVFTVKGVRPRTWWERKGARQSQQLSMLVLSASLAALLVLIALGAARAQ